MSLGPLEDIVWIQAVRDDMRARTVLNSRVHRAIVPSQRSRTRQIGLDSFGHI